MYCLGSGTMPSLSPAALLGCGVLSHCLVRLVFAVLLPVASAGCALGDGSMASCCDCCCPCFMARTADAAAIAVASVGTTLLSLSRILVPSGSVTVGASTAATTLALETLSFKLTGSRCLAVSRSCWGFMGCGSLIILCIYR